MDSIGHTVKKEQHLGPHFGDKKREMLKIAGDLQESGKRKLSDGQESGDVMSQQEEGVIDFESKSFGAQASKFQTQPNKKRNKVIIVDEEEEKEFGINTSINNHISIGSIQDQDQRLMMLAAGGGYSALNNNEIMRDASMMVAPHLH